MARKSLGFVPLIWECPFCSTQNPGPIKTCTSCGAPQPKDIAFTQVDEEKFNFIKDEALIRMAKAGPDIHCPFCGTRNPSTADLCSNCGGDISMGGKARAAGKRVQTKAEAKQTPPAPAPEQKKKRSPLFPILVGGGILGVIVACIILIMLLVKTDDVTATVTGVAWERSVAVEEYTTVTGKDWWDKIPEGADILSCSEEYRYTSNEPEPNATEVCGEPYTEDTGTGVGEVVQDCTYEVYDDYCEYSGMGWVVIDTVTETGTDLYPDWPFLSLANNQREGERTENYRITFSGDGETYSYTTTNSDIFLKADRGSRWTLQVNQLGGVQSAEPSN